MVIWLRHLHPRDYRFLAFVLVNLLCVAAYLFAHVQTLQQETGGWRRIDLDAVMSRIESGDLLQHEAAWYHDQREGKRKTSQDSP